MNKAFLMKSGLSFINKTLLRQGVSSNFRINNRIITSCLSCKLHHSTFQPSLLYKSSLYLPNVNQIRWKKKKQSGAAVEEESDDEDREDFETEDGSKATKVVVTSLRVDVVLKSSLGVARNKLEVLFYEGKIRVNEEKLKKKSDMVRIGDTIDIVLGPGPNPDLIFVNRVEILGAHEKDATRLTLHIHRQKKLLVPLQK